MDLNINRTVELAELTCQNVDIFHSERQHFAGRLKITGVARWGFGLDGRFTLEVKLTEATVDGCPIETKWLEVFGLGPDVAWHLAQETSRELGMESYFFVSWEVQGKDYFKSIFKD